MPVSEAKRIYMRGYMRKVRAIARQAQEKAQQAMVPLHGAALISQVSKQVSQSLLADELAKQDWTVERHLRKRIALTEFADEKPGKNGEGTIVAANGDVQCRAMDAMDKVMEKAGVMPSVAADTPTSSGARVRMVQIDPDGTERVLEIG